MKLFLFLVPVLALLFQSCGVTVDVQFHDPAATPVDAEAYPPTELTPVPVLTPTEEVWREIRTTSSSGQFVRVGPGTEFAVMGVMGANDVCELDIGDDPARLGQRNEWVRVRCVGFEGWAAAWLLEMAAYG
jgi:hypothetical protein